MASQTGRLVVLVHGWSVYETSVYGGLAERLEMEARREPGLGIDVRQIWLSEYVSFRDEVRLEDVSRAFEAAVRRELGPLLDAGRRFACITHSTGGPVVRDWWDRYYVQRSGGGVCPMSHLIMLAPANFGSALAQLGKGRVGRLRAWFAGVEPGQHMLDWLELGSTEAWALNRSWFDYPRVPAARQPVFPFVLTGQSIDRHLYDPLNTYTGELGSDGVVRVAAANLNATLIQLEQRAPVQTNAGPHPGYTAKMLRLKAVRRAPRTAFALIAGKAHSGEKMGIMQSIRADATADATVDAVLACLRVGSRQDYLRLCDVFDTLTADVQHRERVETPPGILLPGRRFIHDPYSMLIFRVRDDAGYMVEDFDLALTAGPGNDPNHLPAGFFADRQKNGRNKNALTFFLNHAIMAGDHPLLDVQGGVLREALPGAGSLGIHIRPYPGEGLVHYLPAALKASVRRLAQFMNPHETTLVDITLRRIVRARVARLTNDKNPNDFRQGDAGPAL
ncbi:hypothetical protein BI364_02810 [Acidihalobacter yilgarnensis]|uniref:Phospholipase n=1 Tax=Acidihalobacter yilgarnensis TaxID=2819280 RepID=A0A1D8IKT3_9GAMM|nr:hypothetical protein [Acidihalobacter yilgarnensis]AOU97074.1 hypothetical protein BI364_02810 [Acidihalobacter yilgarnensis]